MTANRLQDNFSIKNIGTGGLYQAGKLGSQFKRRGLAGALRSAKGAGKYSYAKNLSGKDLEAFQSVVGQRLARLSKHSEGLSLKTRKEIMSEFEKMRLSGKISATDKKDFRDIVEALAVGANKPTTAQPISQPKEPILRATNFATDKSNKVLTPAEQRHIQANINIDIGREIALEEHGLSPISHDPKSTLGQFEQAQKAKELGNKAPTNAGEKPEETEKPAPRPVIELDI